MVRLEFYIGHPKSTLLLHKIKPLKHPNMVDPLLDPRTHPLIDFKAPFRPRFRNLFLRMDTYQTLPHRYLVQQQCSHLLHPHILD